jgi:hypothetical protein
MPGPVSKVPPALHALVMQLAGDGKTSEEIADILLREHRCETSSRAVRRLIERHRTEQADVAKSVVREELRRHLVPLVKRAARAAKTAGLIKEAARRRARDLRALPDGHPQHPQAIKEDVLALKALDRELRAANLLMHYAGLNQPDQPGAPTAPADRAALLERVQKLIAHVGAAEPKSEPPIH